MDAEAEKEGDPVLLPDSVRLMLGVTDGVAVGVTERLGLVVAVAVVVWVLLLVGVPVLLAVPV